MLKHEDNPQTPAPSPSQPAAKVRVTPEELAAAITRLEAKKDAHQRQADGTVAIGDVVEQLGLEATPEEVLAEIESGRRAQAFQRGTRMSLKQRSGLILAAGVLIASFIAMQVGSVSVSRPIPSNDASIAVVTPPFVPNTPEPHGIIVNPDLLVGDSSGKLVLLSEVGDNQPVQTNLYNHAVAFSPYSENDRQNTWTLIKHSGIVYIRGWVQAISTKVLTRDGAGILSPNPSVGSPGFIRRITLPTSCIETSSDGDGMFHAKEIILDKHAYEKWNP